MNLDVQGKPAYADNSGGAAGAAQPVIIFVHGAHNDHSVWAFQSRHFAEHGYTVLALDLPGHGRSAGPALTTVEQMAEWLIALMDAAGVETAVLAGHSMGSLIALEAASRAPDRVGKLALLGATWPMKVAPALLEMARLDEPAAIEMVAQYSQASGTPDALRSLMQRMSAINPDQLLYTDLFACNAYANGEAAARALQCEVLFIMGSKDKMTPPRSSALLTGAVAHGRTVSVDCGHTMMSEQPEAVLEALSGFVRAA